MEARNDTVLRAVRLIIPLSFQFSVASILVVPYLQSLEFD